MTNGSNHAFPHIHIPSTGGLNVEGGLSKRELFAAMAMQGLLGTEEKYHWFYSREEAYPGIASYAVMHADALLAELEKKE